MLSPMCCDGTLIEYAWTRASTPTTLNTHSRRRWGCCLAVDGRRVIMLRDRLHSLLDPQGNLQNALFLSHIRDFHSLGISCVGVRMVLKGTMSTRSPSYQGRPPSTSPLQVSD